MNDDNLTSQDQRLDQIAYPAPRGSRIQSVMVERPAADTLDNYRSDCRAVIDDMVGEGLLTIGQADMLTKRLDLEPIDRRWEMRYNGEHTNTAAYTGAAEVEVIVLASTLDDARSKAYDKLPPGFTWTEAEHTTLA